MTHIITLHDYLRPWKLFSLACGIGILLVGSVVEQAMDWDFPISFIMAISTYILLQLPLVRYFTPIFAKTGNKIGNGGLSQFLVYGCRWMGYIGHIGR